MMISTDDRKRPPAPLAAATLAGRPLRAGPALAGPRPAPARPATSAGQAQPPAAPHARPAPPAAAAAAAPPRAATAGAPRRRGAVRAALLLAPAVAGARLAGAAVAAAGRLLLPGGAAGADEPRSLSDCRVFPSLLPSRAGGGAGGRPGGGGARGPALVWYRSDLRVTDHEPLAAANEAGTSVVPVYCFDPREYGQAPGGFDRTGPYRASLVLSALHELRAALRGRGSDLVVRVGRPEDMLPQLAAAVGAARVYCHGEATAEERRVEAAVARALDERGAALEVSWGGTLFHPDDLPFKPCATPLTYGEFRDRVAGGRGRGGRAARRGGAPVRRPLPAPESLKGLPAGSAVPPGEIPTLRQLGFSDAAVRRARADASAAGAGLAGGERQALQHVEEFARHLRPGAGRGAPPAFSSRVSPWLAIGCVSPRTLYHSLRERLPAAGAARGGGGAPGEGTGGEGGGLSWLLFELMWRDFFRFVNQRFAEAGAGAGAAAGKQAAAAGAPAFA